MEVEKWLTRRADVDRRPLVSRPHQPPLEQLVNAVAGFVVPHVAAAFAGLDGHVVSREHRAGLHVFFDDLIDELIGRGHQMLALLAGMPSVKIRRGM